MRRSRTSRQEYRPRIESLESRLQPSFLTGGGLGEWDPISDNLTPDGATLDNTLGAPLPELAHRRALSHNLSQTPAEFHAGGAGAMSAPNVAPGTSFRTLATTTGVVATATPRLNTIPILPAPGADAGLGASARSASATAISLRHDLVARVTSHTFHGQSASTPSLVYSTYRGVTGPNDADNAVRLKASTGETFVAGSSDDSGTPAATVTVVSADGSTYTQNEIVFPGATSTVANSIDLDGAGNVYIAGTSDAPGFPAAFVAQLDPTGSTMNWVTGIGLSGVNAGSGVRVNDAGTFVYMTGSFNASGSTGHASDILVAKLATGDGSDTGGFVFYYNFSLGATAGSGIALTSQGPRGSLTLTDGVGTHAAAWATPDNGANANLYYYFATGTMLGAATDAAGNVYTTGYENDPALGPNKVLLVAKFTPDQSINAIWAFYYTNMDGNFQGNAIAVSGSGATAIPYVAGFLDNSATGAADAVVLKFTADGTMFTDSAVFLGSGGDAANGLDLDTADIPNAYVAGITASTDFPTTTGAAQTAFSGGVTDGFVAQVAGLSS